MIFIKTFVSPLTLIASTSTSPSSPVPPPTTSGWSLIRVRHHISSITTRHHSLISWIVYLALVALIVVRLVGLLVEHLLWHLHLMLLKLLWVHILRLLIIHSSHVFLSRVEPFLVIMLLLLGMSVISAHSSSSWCFDSWSATKENDSKIKILGSESFTKWLVWDASARDFLLLFYHLVRFKCPHYLCVYILLKLHSFLSKKTFCRSPPSPKILGQKAKNNH